MSIVQKLTADVVTKSRKIEMAGYVKKWAKIGLLEGIKNDHLRCEMAQMLQNEAKLLKEMTSMGAGDIEGFAAVAFPLVRRIFGTLIANELVSVQSMSLPSGLIFFLDFTYTSSRFGREAGASIFGGLDRNADTPAVGSDLLNGISLAGTDGRDPGGLYNLGGTYAAVTGAVDTGSFSAAYLVASDRQAGTTYGGASTTARVQLTTSMTDVQKKLFMYDPDLIDIAGASSTAVYDGLVVSVAESDLVVNSAAVFDGNYAAISCSVRNPVNGSFLWTGSVGQPRLINRLTRKDELNTGRMLLTFVGATTAFDKSSGYGAVNAVVGLNKIVFPIKENLTTSGVGGIGALKGAYPWGLEVAGGANAGDNAGFPEIDIKVNSSDIRAETKKLKAKWTLELSQDLSAYQNVDAEVELTEVLSEQIALEIDQELLTDLIKGATAGTLWWSARPGNFVNPETGASIASPVAPPDFYGTPNQWYQQLVKTVNDVSARIHRKTLRGAANFIVCGPELSNILESTNQYAADVVQDELKGGSVGTVKQGSLGKKWDVYVDPYFLRNVILVGRKGKGFLESGYVFAPYVPLQVTPTIFGTEDFIPRKAVMTRYGKKMVRPDMYGLVIVQHLLG